MPLPLDFTDFTDFTEFTEFTRAARRLRPATAVVLGSGLGPVAEQAAVAAAVPYARVPSLVPAGVDGHRGELLLAELGGRPVLLFAGRLHYYEGHPWEQVTAPVRVARELGVRRLLLTNAAGGIRDDLTPGTLMAVEAHYDWTGRDVPGDRAVRRAEPYSRPVIEGLEHAAKALGFVLARGAYAAVTGPNYETPAEVRALAAVGADAVGMSTAREMAAAYELGLEAGALSCITNRAAGLSATPLTHEEVLANSLKQSRRVGDLIGRFLEAGP
jgi:purine-nucleoside phosphorylase